MIGVEHLNQCLLLVLKEVRELRQEIQTAHPQEDMTAPLTAGELCKRWCVEASTPALRLTYLARKCKAWGLRPLKGTRGESAMFARDAVLHAEAVGAGKINRRRNA